MAVPSVITDLNVTAGSNSPLGSEAIGTSLDDYLRGIQSIIRREQAQGAAIPSASTVNIGSTTDGNYVHITGTTAITSFGTVSAGVSRTVVFDGALTLTHNATSLILPGATNITTAAGDVGEFVSEGSGNWRCVKYIKADGTGISPRGSQTFTANGTFTVPAAVTSIKARLVGGGGGGGGSTNAGGTCGGGGAGGYAEGVFSVVPGATYAVTIGSAGSGGAGGGNGGTGGTTSLGALLSATGGTGGGGTTTASVTAGGSGGTATGGPLNGVRTGAPGINATTGFPGTGASSLFGGGGPQSGGAGQAGTGYGSGGSGASGINLGGVGTAGIVIVEW